MLHEVRLVQSRVPPMDMTHGLDKLTEELSTQQIKLYKSAMTIYLMYAIHASNVSATEIWH